METREQVCCFSGHRSLPDSQRAGLAVRLMAAIEAQIESGVTLFISGGARGFDLLAAEAVLAQKARHPHIRLLMALPCPEQTRGWPASEVRRYRRVLSLCDEQVTLAPAYSRECMLARDCYMVNRSARCICYLNRPRGGTAYTVRYAVKRGLEIINLA